MIRKMEYFISIDPRVLLHRTNVIAKLCIFFRERMNLMFAQTRFIPLAGPFIEFVSASAQFSVSLINSGDIVVLSTAHYCRRHSSAKQYGDFMEMSVVSRKAALNRSPRMDMYGQTDALPATIRPHSLAERGTRQFEFILVEDNSTSIVHLSKGTIAPET
jgi:hypothetical protein